VSDWLLQLNGEVYAYLGNGMFRLETHGFYDTPERWNWIALTDEDAAEICKTWEAERR
jgi:hypothetical protein